MYQLMFAIITPALIIGAVAERMNSRLCIVFVGLWMFAVYFPIAHMVWGIDGLMNGVWNPDAKSPPSISPAAPSSHLERLVGARLVHFSRAPARFRKEIMAPHSMVLCMVGTGCFGWAGTVSMLEALWRRWNGGNAFMTTTLATAEASFTWAMLEYALRGKPSVLGFCSGAVGGLVVITPACGYVAPMAP